VGGTSFENFNPGTNPKPRYPRAGESVWNPQNLCSNAPASPATGGKDGLYPTVRGFDEATGIGTIKMAPFIIGSF
jgi:hypothetical protein